MSRKPTYVRLNTGELENHDPSDFANDLLARKQELMIEDDRAVKLDTIPVAWQELASVIKLGGRRLKDRNEPIDPTERRGLGTSV